MPLTVLHSPEEWSARFGAGVRTVLSVGNFDGLHLGHQKILRMVLARARETACAAAAVTFDPHPMKLLRPDNAPRMIQTYSQRLAGLEQMGLDAALVLRFDRALSLLSPEDFLQWILIDRMHVAAIMVGANFCFGHRGAGDVRLLTRFGKEHGFDVETVSPVEVGGNVVSRGERWRGRAVARPSIFAYGGDSGWSGARANDPVSHAQFDCGAGIAAEAGGVRDGVGGQAKHLSVGDECGNETHVRRSRRYRGEPFVRIRRRDFWRGDGGTFS